jgi:hypothetical protein
LDPVLDPDPHQKVTDPQHWPACEFLDVDQVYGGQQAGMPPMMAKPMQQQQQQQQRSKNYPFPTNRQHNPGKPVPTGRQDKTKESKEMSG